MNKARSTRGRATVTFTLDPRVSASRAEILGDWNSWTPDCDVMERDEEGGFSLTVQLEAGRNYRFRYLLDGERWENDWAADSYVPNDFGGDDSVVDLTALATAAPPRAAKASKAPPATAAPSKKPPATKAATAKKAAAKKPASGGTATARKRPPASES